MLLGQPQRLVILAALILVLKYCSNGNSAAASAFTQKLDDEKTKRKSDNTDPKAGPVPLSSSSFGLGSELGLEPGKDIDQDVLNQAIQRAGQGNTEAQYFLGLLRYYGAGLARDPAQALDLFRRRRSCFLRRAGRGGATTRTPRRPSGSCCSAGRVLHKTLLLLEPGLQGQQTMGT
ncbi:unnamed protein product [Heterosigma akashiwo]